MTSSAEANNTIAIFTSRTVFREHVTDFMPHHGKLQSSIKITNRISCSCFFCNLKNTGFLSKKFFICKGWICFIKCYMTINSNSTETDINAPQFFNQFRNIFRMIRIRKYSLIFRHYQFRANFIINCTLHEASEA